MRLSAGHAVFLSRCEINHEASARIEDMCSGTINTDCENVTVDLKDFDAELQCGF